MPRFFQLHFSIVTLILMQTVASFSTIAKTSINNPEVGLRTTTSCRTSTSCQQTKEPLVDGQDANSKPIENFDFSRLAASALLVTSLVMNPFPVSADEYGRETEAPTLFTGEGVMICTKRGPLGACLETEMRTAENDNDKSNTYFKASAESTLRKDAEALNSENESSALIQRLRQQTSDNREKNELLVQQKTFMNDQSASFGPFDRQVLIMNENGRGFTLLENPQAMRLKEAGFIKDKRFVKQPTEEEITNALTADEPGLFERFFGGN